jgi:hypothetical protein
MARKRRKTAARKRKKKSRSVTRKKSRALVKKRKLRKRRRAKTLGDKVSNAYHTVVDTIKGTDALRNKMEPPSTSETE